MINKVLEFKDSQKVSFFRMMEKNLLDIKMFFPDYLILMWHLVHSETQAFDDVNLYIKFRNEFTFVKLVFLSL